jgi:hypothetical protein
MYRGTPTGRHRTSGSSFELLVTRRLKSSRAAGRNGASTWTPALLTPFHLVSAMSLPREARIPCATAAEVGPAIREVRCWAGFGARALLGRAGPLRRADLEFARIQGDFRRGLLR